MSTDAYGKSTYKGAFPVGALGVVIGDWLNKAFEKMFQGGVSRQYGITAHAGGTKAAAFQLTKSFNEIDTCATNDDSVLLPKAIAGSMVVITNNGVARAGVYGQGTDTINGQATATEYQLAAGKTAIFVCHQVGAWFAVLSA